MLEVVALSALTAFLTAVGNGAAGEMGKQMLLSTGVLVRRTLGWQASLPADQEQWQALARQVYARIGDDPEQAGEWARLVQSFSEPSVDLLPTGGFPPSTRDFTNRQKVLRQLRREASRPADGRPRVALLHGPPGIGTTAVARHLGATLQNRFPDGQFYVDLRDGPGENGPEPATVLVRVLRKMGVSSEDMPSTGEGRGELYHRLIAGRRALVVVDHASAVAQVRSLIPATPEVFLLVVVSGGPFALAAERVPVPPLSDRYAVQLVRKVAGQEGYAHAKNLMPGLLETCAGNAFALKTEALRLQAEAGADGRERRAEASAGADDPVRGAVRGACERLRPRTVRLVRLTALGGWPSVDARIAAAAAGITPQEAVPMLAEASEAGLLETTDDGRFRYRPEVRRCLADAAGPQYGIPECTAAMERVLDLLLNRALHAAHAALPLSWRTEPAPEEGEACDGEAQGIEVLAAEAGNLVRAVVVADEYRYVERALRLARALWPLQLKAGYWDEVLPALRVATDCADKHQPHSAMAGALHFQLAHCLGELKRWNGAEEAARAAIACERAYEHLRGEASAVELLGLLELAQWRHEPAYERFVEAESILSRITADQEGAADLPRAFALAGRHRGRALRGMRRFTESRELLEAAADFFENRQEDYNRARALTDLAETLHEEGDDDAALTTISTAERLLTAAAAPHLRYLAGLRLRCTEGHRPE